jgi:hypothetical protein
MRAVVIISFLLYFLPNLNAQVVFCPPGAQWSYNFREFWTWNALSNEKITYVGDSILGNDTLKILEHSKSFTYCNIRNCSPTLIKVRGDTVFFSNNCTQYAWQILYNFAALPGQTWTNTLLVRPNNPQTVNYANKVLAIGTVSINSMVLKSYSVETTGSNTVFNTTVTERLGCSRFLFNFYANIFTDADEVSRNLCYKDNEFGTAQFTEFSCDYSNPVGMAENSADEVSLSIFPNPGAEQIEIKLKTPAKHVNVKFTDVGGRLIKQSGLNVLTPIDIKDLQDGFYLIQVLSENGKLLGKCKFIKHHE